MIKPHKWAKEIKAWADGAKIECKHKNNPWAPSPSPQWYEDYEYRIKPQQETSAPLPQSQTMRMFVFANPSQIGVRLTANPLERYKNEICLGSFEITKENFASGELYE